MSGQAFQGMVSGLMPEEIVNGFEMIHISHDKRQGVFVTGGVTDLFVKNFVESLVVVQIRHAVEAYLLPKLVQTMGLTVDLVQQLARQIGQLDPCSIDYFDVSFFVDLHFENWKNTFDTFGDLFGNG